jgi:hypothetical protein
MNLDDYNISEENNEDLLDLNLTSSISSTNLYNGTGSIFSNGIGVYSVSSGNIFGMEDLKDIFILMMKDLEESSIENILNTIKEKQPGNYNHCLINLIAYPNFKLMSEQFMINRYEDIKTAMKETHKEINFALTYGSLLDTMPGFKLLLLL